MADKILSLESVKKCLEKIKELLSTKVSVVEQPKENNSVKLQLGDAGTQLYFHGSTSPNIPVLKKKTITGTTSSTGNIPFSESPIILSAYSDVLVDERYSYRCVPWTNASGRGYIRIVNTKTNELVLVDSVGNLTVYYLEIPSGYEIPDTTTASDEPEDDEGLAPQASYTNEESANYEE